MSLDIGRLRAETPGLKNVLHFNNAGAALMPSAVSDRVKAHLDLESGIGGYEAAAAAAQDLDGVYGSIARLINAQPHEIAVVENATRAWDMAFYSLARTFRAGDRILTPVAEYVSNYLAFLQVARQTGVEIITVPSDATGQVDVAALEALIDDRVKLIALTHAPTNGGLIQPAAEVGRIARVAGIPYLLDICQSAGQVPIDVQAIGCDMASATGRKYLRGPRGTGFLYVRDAWIEKLEPPFIDLHAARWTAPQAFEIREDARRFENWETNFAGKVGLKTAVDYALAVGPDAAWDRIQALGTALRQGLSSMVGIQVRDQGMEQGGIVTFSHEATDAATLKAGFAEVQMNVTVSPRDYALIDAQARDLPDMVRASVHYYNDESEIARFLNRLADLI